MNQTNKNNIDKIRNSAWGFFINRRPIAWLITISIIIAGTFSALILPREINPEISIPIGSVSTALHGANPSDIEYLITKPLEKEIGSIANIKNLSSGSSFGMSTIVVEFDADVDIDKSIQDLKEAVDKAKTELPEEATEPFVIKAEANDFPVITFSLIGDQALYEITNIAEKVQYELEKITDVSKVDLIGGQKKQIYITVNQKKAESYGLTLQNISDKIKSSNHNFPIGTSQIDQQNYSLRIDNRYKNLNDIKNIPILNKENTLIFLKDIAKVEENYPAEEKITKFSIKGKESKKAVSLSVSKNKGGNLIKIADITKAKIEELKEKGTIPNNIKISVSNDNSLFIRSDLGLLTKNGIQTTILIIFLLFLALGLKEGLIAGFSIPVTFLIAFTIMDATGMTINSLSLFSLVIALGLMVDTAIVIMEGTHENLKNGFSPKDAALLSVETYKWPLIAGTMTTIFAFFPMLLVSGMLGQFLRTLPITISAALLGSLFVSLTIGPSIASQFLKSKEQDKHTSILEPFFNKIGEFFYKFIHIIIHRKIFRILTITIAITAFAASMILPITQTLKIEMFPKTDVHYFIVNIEIPKGIVIEKTEEITKKIEEILYEVPEIESFLTIIGSGQSQAITDMISFGSSTSSNLANITANLIPKEEREKKSYEIVEELNKKFAKITDAKVNIQEISDGPPTESPITIRITGNEISTLKRIANDVENIINKTPETQNTEISIKSGLNEFKFKYDRNMLSLYMLNEFQVSTLIRSSVQGIDTSDLTLNGEDLNIITRFDLKRKNNKTAISLNEIQNIQIPSPKGYSVSFGQLGKYTLTESLESISREDQKRIIKVTSDVSKQGNVAEITKKIQEKLDKYEIPKEYEVHFGGDLEDIKKSFQELFISMFVGLILIAFTLVLMFNSFKQPLIILFTLPLALIGVFPGLYLIGLNLSFPAFLGVVALTGVVVNDAIVLIDRINQNRKKGIEFKEAIAEAANARLQPILMTTITTVAGILPLAISNEFWAGLGFALVFGLICATFLTLIVIPVLYYILCKPKKIGYDKS